jgi:hypothetical protein
VHRSPSTAIRSRLTQVQITARHEIGHLMGLDHSAGYMPGSLDGTATMATCVSTASKSFTFDDKSSLASRESLGLASNFNGGYENGFAGWYTYNATTSSISASDSHEGSRYGTVTSLSYGGYAYQRFQITELPGLVYPYVLVYSYRNHPGTPSSHRTYLYHRTIDYASGANGCSYSAVFGGQNPNAAGPGTVGLWLMQDGPTQSSFNDWRTNVVPPPYPGRGTADAMEFEIRLRPLQYNVPNHFDSVRVTK